MSDDTAIHAFRQVPRTGVIFVTTEAVRRGYKPGDAALTPEAKAYVKNLALSEEVKKIAWKGQQRLHKRYQAFAVRGKNKNQIVTALGRELLGFIWAIALEAEKQQKLGKAA